MNTTTKNELHHAEHDWGIYLYVPTTLRQLESAGVLLNSRFGCDDAEHDELLDNPDILRIVVDSSIEGTRDGYCSRSAEVECLEADIAGESRWVRATPLPTEQASRYGDLTGNQANRDLVDDSRTLLGIVTGNPDFLAALNAAEEPVEQWWREEQANTND